MGWDEGLRFGQNGHWPDMLNQAVIHCLPAAQPLMAMNGCFRHPRRTAPDIANVTHRSDCFNDIARALRVVYSAA